jgi:hypothetical protein
MKLLAGLAFAAMMKIMQQLGGPEERYPDIHHVINQEIAFRNLAGML